MSHLPSDYLAFGAQTGPAEYIARHILPMPETEKDKEALQRSGVTFERWDGALGRVTFHEGGSAALDQGDWSGRIYDRDGKVIGVFQFFRRGYEHRSVTHAGENFWRDPMWWYKKKRRR